MVRGLLALLAAVVGLVACFRGSAGADLPLRAAVANDIGQPPAAVSSVGAARAHGGPPEPATYVYDAAASATIPPAAPPGAFSSHDDCRTPWRSRTRAFAGRIATKAGGEGTEIVQRGMRAELGAWA